MFQHREIYSLSKCTENLTRRIFVGNISVTGHRKLKTFFKKFGQVEDIELPYDEKTGLFKRIAYVTFTRVKSVLKALYATKGQLLFTGRVLRVYLAASQPIKQLFSHGMQSKPKIQKDDVITDSDDGECEHTYSERNLNIDCLLHIFSFLSIKARITCERVCKYWRSVSHLSWKLTISLDFSDLSFESRWKWDAATKCPVTDANIEKVLKRTGGKVERINLTSATRITSKLPKIICEYAPHLSNLSLSKTNGVFTMELGDKLGRFCKNLRVLSLRDCVNMKDGSLDRLLQHNPLIQEIDLSACYHYKNRIAGTFIRRATNLCKLSLCYSVVKSEQLNWILYKCRETIEELDLRNLDTTPSLLITTLCPNLRRIDISYMGNSVHCRDIQPVVVDLSGASYLEEFVAVYANGFTFDIGNMKELVKCCPCLRKLNFSSNGMILRPGYSGVRVFMNFIGNLTELTHLDLSYSDLRYAGELEEILKLKKLVSLNLCGSELCFFEPALVHLIEQLPSLAYLDISGVRLNGGHLLKDSLYRLAEKKRCLTLVIGGCCLYALNGISSVGEYIEIDRTDNCEWMLRLPYMKRLIKAQFEEYVRHDDPYPRIYNTVRD